MREPTFYDSAYPGSMSKNKDGGYVKRADNESLVDALLSNLYEEKKQADDWRDNAIRLESELIALRAKLAAAEKRLNGLRELCGYIECGEGQLISIEQDDATRSWIVRVGKKRWWSGDTFFQALDVAIESDAARKGR